MKPWYYIHSLIPVLILLASMCIIFTVGSILWTHGLIYRGVEKVALQLTDIISTPKSRFRWVNARKTQVHY